MPLIETSVVLKALIGAGVKPALTRAQRTRGVLALLKRFNLMPKTPLQDFDSIYAYALIEYCYGRPAPIIKFFGYKYIVSAFRKSFTSGDPSFLLNEAEHTIDWNRETHQLGYLTFDVRREFAGFTAIFNEVVSSSRTMPQARIESKLERLHLDLDGRLADLTQAVESLPTAQEVRTEILGTPMDIEHRDAALSALERELTEWFTAVGYGVESSQRSNTVVTWTLNVRASRKRYDRILVHGVAREATVADAADLRASTEEINADEGWLVAPRRVSLAARELAKSEPQLSVFTVDELIDEEADFTPYLDWLDREVKLRNIDTNYVQLSARKEEVDTAGLTIGISDYEPQHGGIEGYIESWVNDPSKEHLSILGEFGTGKSWLTLHFAWLTAQRYKEAKEHGLPRPRLPLVIPLRDYAKAVNIESLFSEFFFRRHEIQLPGYSAFEQLNRMGRLLLLFDGFDEMAARVDRQEMVNNFWELARVVTPRAKVLLTCRTEHFPESQEGRSLLGAKLKASTQALTGSPPQFEVIDLLPMNDGQVREMLSKITSSGVIETIMSNAPLRELMSRPVMSELVLDALPDIEQGAKVDLARVYLYATRRKMTNDIKAERTFTSLTDKIFFLCELSWEMISSEQMTLNYRAFPDRLRACFGEAVREERDLDHWHYDMLGQTMLIRNSHGDYSPAHRSLLEFFVAYKLLAELGLLTGEYLSLITDDAKADAESVSATYSEFFGMAAAKGQPSVRVASFQRTPTSELVATFGSAYVAPAIRGLMRHMLNDLTGACDELVAVATSTREHDGDVDRLAVNSLELACLLDPETLRGRDLAGLQLRRFDPYQGRTIDCRETTFDASDMSDASLRGVELGRASLRNTVLTRAFGIGEKVGAVNALETTPAGHLYMAGKPGWSLTRIHLNTGRMTISPIAEFDFSPQKLEAAGENWMAVMGNDKLVLVGLRGQNSPLCIPASFCVMPPDHLDQRVLVMGSSTTDPARDAMRLVATESGDVLSEVSFGGALMMGYAGGIGDAFVVTSNSDGERREMEAATAGSKEGPLPYAKIHHLSIDDDRVTEVSEYGLLVPSRSTDERITGIMHSNGKILVLASLGIADAAKSESDTLDTVVHIFELDGTVAGQFEVEWVTNVGMRFSFPTASTVSHDGESRYFVGDLSGISAYDMSSREARVWHQPETGEPDELIAIPNEDKVVVATRYGGIFLLSAIDGEILDFHSIEPSLLECDLSSAQGLSAAEVKDLVKQAGASI